jgi:hypothetical protein
MTEGVEEIVRGLEGIHLAVLMAHGLKFIRSA